MGAFQAGAAIAGAGAKIIGGILNRGRIKQAGTVLQEGYEDEAARGAALPGRFNPFISESYNQARGEVLGAGDTAAGNVEQAAQTGVGYLDPYMQAGSRATTTLSDLVNADPERFSGIDLTMDPSYQFRLQEGQRALEHSAAARGTLRGGGTLKAITNYGQQAASQEYQAAYARALESFKANQVERQNRLTNLSGLVNVGSRAAQEAGDFTLTGATRAGGFRTGAAEKAAGWGIDSANRQVSMDLLGEQIRRENMEKARGARSGSMVASQQAFTDALSAAGGLGQDLFNIWGQNRRPSGGGGYPATNNQQYPG